MAEKIGDLFVEISVDSTKLASNLQEASKKITTSAQTLENKISKLKINFDTSLATMKLDQIKNLYARLKLELDKKIKMNADVSSIELTKAKIQSVENALKNTDTSIKSTSSNFKSLGASMLLITGSITSAIMLIKDFWNSSLQQAKAVIQLEQAVKQTGFAAGFTAEQLRDVASSLQLITGVGDEVILTNVTNQLLTFTRITGDNFIKAQKAVLDLNAVIAQGNVGALVSQSIQLGKALENPIMGMGALSRAGITFTESQKQAIKNLMTQNDLIGAQRIILDEIQAKYGGQAEALANASKGSAQLSAAWGDLKENFGDFVRDFPGLTELINQMAKGFANWGKLFQGNSYYINKFKVELDNLKSVSEQITLDKLKYSSEQALLDLKKFNESQIAYNEQQIAYYNKLLEQEASSVRLNNNKVTEYNNQIKALQKLIAIQKGELSAIEKTEKALKQRNVEWTSQGKTIGEIKDRITELTESLDAFEPMSKEASAVIKQIRELQKLLPEIKENNKKVVDVISEEIDKIRTNIELHELQKTISLEILESSKQILEQKLKETNNIKEQVSLLKEIEQINKKLQEQSLQPIDIDEEEFKSFTDEIEKSALDYATKRVNAEKSSNEVLNRLKLENIDSEFEARRLKILQEADELLKIYSETEGEKLNLTEQYAEIRAQIEKNKALELSRLELERYQTALSAVQTIGSSLQTAFDAAGNSLIAKLNKALQVVSAIVQIIKSLNLLSALFGNVSGAASAVTQLPSASTGGIFSRAGNIITKSSYNSIPKFSNGGTFRVPDGFPNDSYLIRVQSKETVSVLPNNATNSTDAMLSQINNSIQALRSTLINKDLSVIVENKAVDNNMLVKRLKKIETSLLTAGVNFNEY